MQTLLRTFLSTGCAICDRPTDQVFCLDCSRQIEAEYNLTQCPFANTEDLYKNSGNENSETVCKLAVGALGIYQGSLKQAILALKYKNGAQVAQPLGAALAKRYQHQIAQWPRSLCVVPIPLHPNRLAQRGYNQAALIARAFAQGSGLSLAEHALFRCADTKPQHQLGPDARRENLASVFKISSKWRRRLLKSPGKTSDFPAVVLIDDIYTTGATALNAAVTLRAAGLKVVGILVLARAVND